jgi:hypothetical protein
MHSAKTDQPPVTTRKPTGSPLGLMQRLNVRLVIALPCCADRPPGVGATLNQILPDCS